MGDQRSAIGDKLGVQIAAGTRAQARRSLLKILPVGFEGPETLAGTEKMAEPSCYIFERPKILLDLEGLAQQIVLSYAHASG